MLPYTLLHIVEKARDCVVSEMHSILILVIILFFFPEQQQMRKKKEEWLKTRAKIFNVVFD